MIGIGINENVVLKNATIELPKNGQGQAKLILHLTDKAEKAAFDPFKDMNAAAVIEDDTFQAAVWPFKTPDLKDSKGNPLDPKARAEKAVDSIVRTKNVLQQLLSQFLPADQIKWDVYEGTGMTQEDYYDRIVEQGVLDVIYKNLVEQFIAQVSPYLGKPEYALRFKLVRQSAAKHFARIPDMFIEENPFVERMTIPPGSSRVKFTKYELSMGLDDATPVSKDSADKPDEPTPEAENVFGKR